MKRIIIKKNLTTTLILILFLNIISISYMFNFYKFVECTMIEECHSNIIRGTAIVVFPLGMIIGFINIPGDVDSVK